MLEERYFAKYFEHSITVQQNHREDGELGWRSAESARVPPMCYTAKS